MNVLSQLIPLGHPNRPGTKLTALKALVFHYTANDSPEMGDTLNAKWFARKYFTGQDGKIYEKDTKTPFGYGSTQIIADQDSVTMAIPTDEVAWGCGDKHMLPWTPEWKGQQHAAKLIFNNKQNYQSISIEICNNADWDMATYNAAAWAIDFLKEKELKPNLRKSLSPQEFIGPIPEGEILLLRHYDVTGKMCPAPFVRYTISWVKFLNIILEGVLK